MSVVLGSSCTAWDSYFFMADVRSYAEMPAFPGKQQASIVCGVDERLLLAIDHIFSLSLKTSNRSDWGIFSCHTHPGDTLHDTVPTQGGRGKTGGEKRHGQGRVQEEEHIQTLTRGLLAAPPSSPNPPRSSGSPWFPCST